MTGLMQGKRGLIMGLANDKSLAWGIAQKLHEAGAELAFSYQGEALEKRVRPLAASLGSDFLIDCDVSSMEALLDSGEQVPLILLRKETGRNAFAEHAGGDNGQAEQHQADKAFTDGDPADPHIAVSCPAENPVEPVVKLLQQTGPLDFRSEQHRAEGR